MKKSGVKIKTNMRIGEDISFDELLKNYKAVFIATGAHKSRKLNIPGEDADGVIEAMEFLKDVNLDKKVNTGKRVGIIGGGNSAVDAARAAVRIKECDEVYVIYRRTIAEMPAFEEEVDAAVEEGVKFQFLTAPTKVLTENGKLAGIECIKMELGDVDESGRRRPVPVKGSEYVINLNTLIVAIGEKTDTGFLGQNHGIALSEWNTIEVDSETYASSREGVFAGGDVVTGPDTVINAMSSGKIAAEMIDKYIKGEKIEREYKLTRPSMYLPPVELTEEEIEKADRPAIPCLPLNERINNFKEVDLNMTEEMAVKEARRCLRCDLETEEGKG